MNQAGELRPPPSINQLTERRNYEKKRVSNRQANRRGLMPCVCVKSRDITVGRTKFTVYVRGPRFVCKSLIEMGAKVYPGGDIGTRYAFPISRMDEIMEWYVNLPEVIEHPRYADHEARLRAREEKRRSRLDENGRLIR